MNEPKPDAELEWVKCPDCDGDEGTRDASGEWVNCSACGGSGGWSRASAQPATAEPSAEQRARDLLERMGYADAQSRTAGDLVELADVLAQLAHAESLIREIYDQNFFAGLDIDDRLGAFLKMRAG